MVDADVVVLGGGSGGYAAAIRATELGKSVILIERDRVGGTCLHRGCIPTKALLHVAEVADTVRDAAFVGVVSTLDRLDPDRIREYREGIVAKKFAGLQGLLKTRGVTVVTGSGALTVDGAVQVGDVVYRGTDVILATGATSRTLPSIEVGGRVLTSEGALALPHIPRSAIVLGGGVIGVEFASLWRSLGVEVTILEAVDRLLPPEDAAVSRVLERAFRKRGIGLALGSRVDSVTQDAASVTVTTTDAQSFTAEYLLVAVGRAPATAGLGFDDAGVRLNASGFVEVDAGLRTTAPHIWAVGDIVEGVQLAHRGFQHGIAVAERIAGQSPAQVPDTLLPKVTYSHPEVASVGLTEAAARDEHGHDRIHVNEVNLAGNAKSEIIGTGGLVKVVRIVDGPVVGVHLVGDRVGELITEAQLVVGWDAHPEDVAPFVHAHPTQSEALGEAFLALAGKPLHQV